jgi:hypothetical protein
MGAFSGNTMDWWVEYFRYIVIPSLLQLAYTVSIHHYNSMVPIYMWPIFLKLSNKLHGAAASFLQSWALAWLVKNLISCF